MNTFLDGVTYNVMKVGKDVHGAVDRLSGVDLTMVVLLEVRWENGDCGLFPYSETFLVLVSE